MRHIRNYENFKESKIDEGLIGNLFNKLKKKLSTEFSKKFRTGPKVDKVIEEYRKEIILIYKEKTDILKKLGDYIKTKKDEVEDKTKKDEVVENISKDPHFIETLEEYKKVSEQSKKEKELLKKKYDLKFEAITDDEKDKKIINYVNIKKIELEQEFLRLETDTLINKTGLTENDIKNNKELTLIMKRINGLLKQSEKSKEEQANAIKSEKKEKDSEKTFDVGSKYKYTNEEKKEVEITIKEVKNDGRKVVSAEVKNDDGKLVTINPKTKMIGDKVIEEKPEEKPEEK